MKTVALIFSDRWLTRFMQDADLFESFKVIVKPKVTVEVGDNWGQKEIDVMLGACEKEPYRLIAVVAHDVVWFDPDVKSVSNGEQWWPFEDYIRFLRATSTFS